MKKLAAAILFALLAIPLLLAAILSMPFMGIIRKDENDRR